jgi:hypothetical protein
MMAGSGHPGADAHRQLRSGFFAILMVLIVQFLIGMAVNLFVTIPRDHPGANPPEYFSGVAQSVAWAVLHGHPFLVLHAALGLVLAFFSVGLLVRAIVSRARGFLWPAILGTLGIVIAGLNGGSFLNYNEDFSSMIMAGAFALAMVAYAAGLFVTARSPSE